MIRIWWKYPLFKPKDGSYLCTVKDRVMILYYDTVDKKWYDLNRLSVFQGYKVYKQGRAVIDENRVHDDGLCERDDVIAFKKIPREAKLLRKLGEWWNEMKSKWKRKGE